MSSKRVNTIVSVATILAIGVLCASIAQAAVVPLAYYRLGDTDSGAVVGGPGADPTADIIAGQHLSKIGAPTYANSSLPGSALAMDFGGAGKYYERVGPVTTAVDNWGVEAWVYPFSETPGDGDAGPYLNFASVAYNGKEGAGSGTGFGLVTTNGEWLILIGQLEFHDVNADVVPNKWTHLAAVRDSGQLALYVDGSQVGGTTGTTPNTPISSDFVHIGGENIFGDRLRSFDGLIDEVRFFSFSPGQFDPATDLLLSVVVPEPSSALVWMTCCLLAGGLVYHVRRRK